MPSSIADSIPTVEGRLTEPVGSAAATGGLYWLSRISEHATYASAVLGPTILTGAGAALVAAARPDAEIAAIVKPRWVGQVITTTLTGERPAELRAGAAVAAVDLRDVRVAVGDGRRGDLGGRENLTQDHVAVLVEVGELVVDGGRLLQSGAA